MGINILIGEDHGIISLDLKLLLERNNFYSFIARSGEDLIEQYKQKKPDLVIADFNLQGKVNGREALKEISKIDETPIIIITGTARKNVSDFAETIPNCSYLIKPFDNSKLLELIEEITR